eukprot:TRINITY_DN10034_c0_g1_i1.p1 TRINITY_DN10034_c0_g1~~TRINITY_DN10034_c0_g1_i1.p1  ORF type:complete len:357 (+),score=15.04 TRINITY_DN10034_c0_g1_i1:29-1072(+)
MAGTSEAAVPMREKLKQLWKLMTNIHTELSGQLSSLENHRKFIDEVRIMNEEKDKTITLNVGGTIFKTHQSVLTCARAEDSMLFAIGARWFGSDTEDDEETFIDRDGTLFGAILSWLRDGDAGLSRAAALDEELGGSRRGRTDVLESMLMEARYYGLDQLVNVVQRKLFRSVWFCPPDPYDYAPVDNDLNHFKAVHKTSSITAIAHAIFPGTKTRLVVEVQHSNDFTFSLEVDEHCAHFWKSEDYFFHTKTELDENDALHTVDITMHWPVIKAANGEFLTKLVVTIEVNGRHWDQKVVPESPFWSLWFGTHQKDSEMRLVSLVEDPLDLVIEPEATAEPKPDTPKKK